MFQGQDASCPPTGLILCSFCMEVKKKRRTGIGNAQASVRLCREHIDLEAVQDEAQRLFSS